MNMGPRGYRIYGFGHSFNRVYVFCSYSAFSFFRTSSSFRFTSFSAVGFLVFDDKEIAFSVLFSSFTLPVPLLELQPNLVQMCST